MGAVFLFLPLLLSVLFIQLGVGVLAPLDVLSGVYHGFSTREIGLLGSAHFVGFIVGCVAAPALMARTGHSRAFAVSAAMGVLSAALHPVFTAPEAWMVLRVAAGFAVAVGYTVVESWFQARTDNASRGRVLSVYRMVDLIGQVGSQLLLIQLSPAEYVSYNVVAAIAVISLLPLALTTTKPPEPPKRPRLRVLAMIRLSPLAAAGVVVVGLTGSSFRMVGPLYGAEFALTTEEIAYFLAAAMLGGAVAQPFVGWIADKFDRRWVLIGLSVAAVIVCVTLSLGLSTADPSALTLGSFLFGAAALPLYSVSAAHANDYCPKDQVVELTAALTFLFAIGAILSPVLAAELITLYGPDALWLYISAAHGGLIIFGLYRMTRRPTADTRTPYRWKTRTSLIVGRLEKRKPADGGAEAQDPNASAADPAAAPARAPRPEGGGPV